MRDHLYSSETTYLVAALFALCVAVLEAGYQAGRRVQANLSDSALLHSITLEAAVLGILGLLFAFAFSMAASRFDARKELVLEEASVIRLAYLTAGLAPPGQRDEMRKTLTHYLAVRIAAHSGKTSGAAGQGFDDEAMSLQREFWSQAREVAAISPAAAGSGALLSSALDLIKVKRRREYAIENTVPQPIIDLLFIVSLLSMGAIGLSGGASNNRNFAFSIILAVLVSFVMLVILDLDKPREGFMRIGEESLRNLSRILESDN